MRVEDPLSLLIGEDYLMSMHRGAGPVIPMSFLSQTCLPDQQTGGKPEKLLREQIR
ncbi:MAG: hypothetical protein LUG51_12450 [Tannerellaceae bacterium]|nr:hypothetical protein [Tannerellaceae bacterium]